LRLGFLGHLGRRAGWLPGRERGSFFFEFAGSWRRTASRFQGASLGLEGAAFDPGVFSGSLGEIELTGSYRRVGFRGRDFIFRHYVLINKPVCRLFKT
jgi:hypothetical protein